MASASGFRCLIRPQTALRSWKEMPSPASVQNDDFQSILAELRNIAAAQQSMSNEVSSLLQITDGIAADIQVMRQSLPQSMMGLVASPGDGNASNDENHFFSDPSGLNDMNSNSKDSEVCESKESAMNNMMRAAGTANHQPRRSVHVESSLERPVGAQLSIGAQDFGGKRSSMRESGTSSRRSLMTHQMSEAWGTNSYDNDDWVPWSERRLTQRQSVEMSQTGSSTKYWPATLEIHDELKIDPYMDWDQFMKDASRPSTFGTLHKRNGSISSSLATSRFWKLLRCPVLDPTSQRRIAFDLLILLVLAYDLVMIPYVLAWDVEPSGTFRFIGISVTTFWTLDMILNFRTGYYNDGDLFMDSSSVAVHYIRTYFVLDMTLVVVDWLSMIFMEQGDFSQTSKNRRMEATEATQLLRIGKIGRMLRVVSLLRIMRIGRRMSVDNIVPLSILEDVRLSGKFLKTVVVVLFVSHYMCCAWYAIGMSDESGQTWLQLKRGDGSYQDAYFWDTYSSAFHFSMAQLTSGCMEVYPMNHWERTFNIACLLFGLLFGTTLIGTLSATMVQYQSMRDDRNRQMEMVIRYLRQNNFDRKVQLQVQKQATAKINEERPLREDQVAVFKHLSLTLRQRLREEQYLQHLRVHALFNLWEQIDSAALNAICHDACQFLYLRAGDDLFTPNTQMDAAYLIIHGDMRYSLQTDYLQDTMESPNLRQPRSGGSGDSPPASPKTLFSGGNNSTQGHRRRHFQESHLDDVGNKTYQTLPRQERWKQQAPPDIRQILMEIPSTPARFQVTFGIDQVELVFDEATHQGLRVPVRDDLFFTMMCHIDGGPYFEEATDAVTFIGNSTWICEAALWCRNWHTTGTLTAEKNDVQVMQTGASAFVHTAQKFRKVRQITKEYAAAFYVALVSACPPDLNFPTDVNVPFSHYSDIMPVMHENIRYLIGKLALDRLQSSAYFSHFTELEKELEEHTSILLQDTSGEIVRIVNIVALHTRSATGLMLVQLASWRTDGTLRPTFSWPARKQKRNEQMSAIVRRLTSDLAPIVDEMNFKEVSREVEWQNSKTHHGIRTKYLRHVQRAEAMLPDSIKLAAAMTKPTLSGARRMAVGPRDSSASFEDPTKSTLIHCHCLARRGWHGWVLCLRDKLYTWMNNGEDSEFKKFQSVLEEEKTKSSEQGVRPESVELNELMQALAKEIMEPMEAEPRKDDKEEENEDEQDDDDEEGEQEESEEQVGSHLVSSFAQEDLQCLDFTTEHSLAASKTGVCLTPRSSQPHNFLASQSYDIRM